MKRILISLVTALLVGMGHMSAFALNTIEAVLILNINNEVRDQIVVVDNVFNARKLEDEMGKVISYDYNPEQFSSFILELDDETFITLTREVGDKNEYELDATSALKYKIEPQGGNPGMHVYWLISK